MTLRIALRLFLSIVVRPNHRWNLSATETTYDELIRIGEHVIDANLGESVKSAATDTESVPQIASDEEIPF
jgi:hypothetical protein